MTDRTFIRLAGFAAIASAPIAVASFLLGPAAFGWDFALLFDPAASIRHPSASVALIRLGWILDIPGYYLLLIPAALVLRAQNAAQFPLASQWAWTGMVVYALTGTIGAALLAAETAVIDRYRAAEIVSQAALLEIHVAMFSIVLDGLWNLLSMSGLVVWCLIAGAQLQRTHRALGAMLLGIGGAAAIDVIGHATGFRTVGETGLFVYLFAYPVFGAWLGFSLLVSGRSGERRDNPKPPETT